MHYPILKNTSILLFSLLVLGSCKITAPKLPATAQAPATFAGRTDTTSIGSLPWKEFFGDPYLVNLIDTALMNNPDLHMAIQRVEFSRANVHQRRGELLPTARVAATAGVEKYGDYTMNGVGNYDTNLSENINADHRIPNPTPDYFLGLRSAWEIDIWGKLRNRKKAAYARFLASEKGKQLVETALVAQVANFYYQLLAVDSELGSIRENIKLQETALELVKIQKIAGRVTELAVIQFSAQLLNTKAMEARVQQNMVEIENQLNLLLGRYPQPIARGKSLLNQELPEEVETGIPADMLRLRPDIQQAELELIAAKADVNAARAAFYPSLTISPYMGFNAFKASLLFNPGSLAYGVLGGLAGPILNRTAIKSEYGKSSASNLEAYYAYQKTVLTGYQEVLTNMRSIESLEKVSDLKEQEVEALRQAVATSNDLFLAGYASYLEVVTAQKSVLEAELDLTNTRKEQFLSLIDLYRSLGGGW
jgi:multidrug efflux system outer membrane protein